MGFRLPELSVIGYGIVGLVASTVIIAKLSRLPCEIFFACALLELLQPLDAFPSVGSKNWLGSWWADLKTS